MIIAAEAALCNALLKDRVDFRALFNGGSTIASVDAHQFERKFKLIPVSESALHSCALEERIHPESGWVPMVCDLIYGGKSPQIIWKVTTAFLCSFPYYPA